MSSARANNPASYGWEVDASRSRRIARHATVLLFAALTTGVVLYCASALGLWLNHRLLAAADSVVPDWLLTVFFVCYFVYVVGIVFPFVVFLGWRLMRPQRATTTSALPMVSVIIPAFNEQATIDSSIRAALHQDYPDYEVIIVDDGSTDLTPYVVEGRPISVVRLQRNRGKAAALNAGIDRAKGDIVVCCDADSFLAAGAIRRLVSHFEEPTVGAVAGWVEVSNAGSLLGCWQVLEYVLGQEVIKNAQLGSARSVTVCPGPVSAFRRRVLLELGGYKERTLAEDFDLTLETVDAGYRAEYEPRAVARTLAPLTWGSLRRQRLRWYRGNLQVFLVHRRLLLSARSGLLGLFWLPYGLVAGFGAVVLDGALILIVLAALHAVDASLADFGRGLVFMVMIEMLGAGQYLVALSLTKTWRPRLAIAALLVKPYHLFIAWIRLESLWRELTRRDLSWNG